MDTKLILAFVVGLLVGWLLEWVIDWIYWRRKYRKENENLRNDVERLQADNQFLQTKITDLENQTMVSQAAFKNQVAEVKSSGERDDLTRIKGIGPAIDALQFHPRVCGAGCCGEREQTEA